MIVAADATLRLLQTLYGNCGVLADAQEIRETSYGHNVSSSDETPPPSDTWLPFFYY